MPTNLKLKKKNKIKLTNEKKFKKITLEKLPKNKVNLELEKKC